MGLGEEKAGERGTHPCDRSLLRPRRGWDRIHTAVHSWGAASHLPRT